MPEGKLYLVATPIGNLRDITLRAIETLKNSDVVLCEDTRRAKILFDAYDIHAPMLSYHSHNLAARGREALKRLLEGNKVSLISDAGSPGISDPGEVLVRSAIANGVGVECVPGPAAFVCALTCSGLPANGFVFLGFLQRKKSRMKKALLGAAETGKTVVFYESPYRIEKTLELCAGIFPEDRRCVVARELTKKFEEFIRGTVRQVAEEVKKRSRSAGERLRGEMVVLIG
jgi:16S rRNA (cytidine1402-2'-O)-methyltransferase